MSPRFIALIALLLTLAVACDSKKAEPESAAVTVTVALSGSQVGAVTLGYWVNHSDPTVLSTPIQGTVAVTDPTTGKVLAPGAAANGPPGGGALS